MHNIANDFIGELYSLSCTDLDLRITHQAKRCLLDYLGVAFTGAIMLHAKKIKLLQGLGCDPNGVAVIGMKRKAASCVAAFVNGLTSHIAELDDGVRFGMIHPGAPVLSALLPAAEQYKRSGMDLIKGIVVGYEAAVRLACAIQPSHHARGYHPTGTCGGVGAALGVAALNGLSRVQMKRALSAAAVSAGGSLKVLEGGSEIKPLNVGRAAVDGLLAASMGCAGFQDPDDVFSGNAGFLAMMCDAPKVSELLLDCERPLAIDRVYVKPYAACRHAHPAIEAALRIRSSLAGRMHTIAALRVRTYSTVLGKHDHTKIAGVASAKMSIPYAVAVALMTGRAGVDEFSLEHIRDPDLLALTDKVKVCAAEDLSALVPHRRAAIVEVTTQAGQSYSERVDYPKGEPENPVTDAELEAKFRELSAQGRRSKRATEEIIRIVWSMENRLPDLWALL